MSSRLLAAVLALIPVVGTAVRIDHPKPADAASQAPWMRKAGDANLPEVVSRRAHLVVTYCGQCHAPPPPALHSSDEWRWMIVRMDMRTWASDRSSLRIADNDELEDIARYYDAYSDD